MLCPTYPGSQVTYMYGYHAWAPYVLLIVRAAQEPTTQVTGLPGVDPIVPQDGSAVVDIRLHSQ